MEKIQPKTIPVEYFMEHRSDKVKPIQGLTIPNIIFPKELSNKRSTEVSDTLVNYVIRLRNTMTSENIPIIKEKLRESIMEKANSEEDLRDVAQVLLDTFLIGGTNISNCMHLLNAVYRAQFNTSKQNDNAVEKTTSTTPVKIHSIGFFFLDKCRNKIFEYISADNIRKIASLNKDDVDELDEYHRQRDNIFNLIETVCYLYEQRKSDNIKLSARQLIPLMGQIYNSYMTASKRAKELGNPYEGEDCEDETEYEILSEMSSIYALLLCSFIKREYKEFMEDLEEVSIVIGGQKTNCQLKKIIELFKVDVIPTLTNDGVRTMCKDIPK